MNQDEALDGKTECQHTKPTGRNGKRLVTALEWAALGFACHLNPSALGSITSRQQSTLLADIEKSRLKVARFSDSNDPFELLALNFKAEPFCRTGMSFKRETDTRTGFISFSRNWIEPVIWSHYADRHKGICLGFDLVRTDIMEIKYNDERLLDELDKYGGDPGKIAPNLQKALLCTKAKGWAYEEECRIYLDLSCINSEKSLYFCPFSRKLEFREVILGARCDMEIADMRALTKKYRPSAIVISARLAFKSFAIVPVVSAGDKIPQ